MRWCDQVLMKSTEHRVMLGESRHSFLRNARSYQIHIIFVPKSVFMWWLLSRFSLADSIPWHLTSALNSRDVQKSENMFLETVRRAPVRWMSLASECVICKTVQLAVTADGGHDAFSITKFLMIVVKCFPSIHHHQHLFVSNQSSR